MYNNPYLPQSPYMQPTQPTIPRQEVVKVNGENGARAFAMGPNSSALLLDESGLLIWLVTTDGAGYKNIGAYDITPHQAAPAPDFTSLEARISKLEEIINANTSNSTDARSKPDCNCRQNNNSAEIEGMGYYEIDATVTLYPTETGDVSVSVYENGVVVPGTTVTGTVAAISDAITLPIVGTVRETCCESPSQLTLVISGNGSSGSAVSLRVEKS